MPNAAAARVAQMRRGGVPRMTGIDDAGMGRDSSKLHTAQRCARDEHEDVGTREGAIERVRLGAIELLRKVRKRLP